METLRGNATGFLAPKAPASPRTGLPTRHLTPPPPSDRAATMDRPAAIAQIREACKNIALQFMKIHPAVPGLADEEAQKECFRCVHEMTVLLETIKKKIGRLERSDDSSLL